MNRMSFPLLCILSLLFISVCLPLTSASTIMTIGENSADSITVIDSMGREVSIQKPVERIAVIDALPQVASTLQAIGAVDTIVAVDETTALEKVPSPEGFGAVNIGSSSEPDLEQLVALDPDLVILGMYATEEKIRKLEDAGFTVLVTSLFPTIAEGFEPTRENTLVLGAITGNEEKAREFATWRQEYLDMIRDRTANLTTSDKPSVMYAYKWDTNKIYGSGSTNRFHYLLDFIGTRDVNSNVAGDWAEVELEHLIAENPEFIIFEEMSHNSGYGNPDTAAMAENIKTLKALPGMDSVDAIAQNQVYGIPVSILTGDTWLAAIYLAPVVHPELFSDLDATAVHQQYMDRFLGVDVDIASDGVFLYPQQP